MAARCPVRCLLLTCGHTVATAAGVGSGACGAPAISRPVSRYHGYVTWCDPATCAVHEWWSHARSGDGAGAGHCIMKVKVALPSADHTAPQSGQSTLHPALRAASCPYPLPWDRLHALALMWSFNTVFILQCIAMLDSSSLRSTGCSYKLSKRN